MILKGNDFTKVASQHIKVVDIIYVEKGQRMPACCILMNSEDTSGEVFLRTDQSDSETVWKRRDAPADTQQRAIQSLPNIEAEIECPNIELYAFNGKLILNNSVEKRDDNQLTFGKPSTPTKTAKSVDLEDGSAQGVLSIEGANSAALNEKTSPVTETRSLEPERREMGRELENTPRAETFISTSAALILVIYTVHGTRSMLNTNKPRNKTGLIEKELDISVMIMAVTSISCFINFTNLRTGFDAGTSPRLIVHIRFIINFS